MRILRRGFFEKGIGEMEFNFLKFMGYRFVL
jgi:hypothetical protein